MGRDSFASRTALPAAGTLLVAVLSVGEPISARFPRAARDVDPVAHVMPRNASVIRSAVVAVTAGSSDGATVRCAGVFINPQWLMTAAHCIDLSGQRAVAVAHLSGEALESNVALADHVVVHPTLDVALLKVETTEPPSTLALAAESGMFEVAHEAYSLAFGPHGAGTSHQRRFVRQVIVSVDSAFLTAESEDDSGPCVGDSGGALIVDDESGAPLVAGILSRGSMSCRGADVYVRADRLRDWVEQTLAASLPNDGAWSAASPSARCFVGGVRRCESAAGPFGSCRVPGASLCEAGQLRSTRCTGSTQPPPDYARFVLLCSAAIIEVL